MTRSIDNRIRFVGAVCGLAVALLLLAAGHARSATTVYPAAAGTFTGGAQGWEATDASCNVPALCTASGGYDGSAGNPPGSIAANTTIGLNLLTVFKSTVTLQSPDFTVSGAGDGTLHLDRQFASGSLLDLAPQATYEVALIDRTAGTKSEPLSEELKADSAFVGKDHAVSVKVGHVYALSITTDTSSTVAGTALAGGTTSVRFDNVSLTVESSGGGGAGAGRGGSGVGLTDQQLRSLIGNDLVGPAILKGNRLSVKVRCPRKAGGACRVTLRGMLNRRKPATALRTTKVRKGKTKRVVLKIKPKARKKVGVRRKLLFKQTVKVGEAKATVYKRLKLIRH